MITLNTHITQRWQSLVAQIDHHVLYMIIFMHMIMNHYLHLKFLQKF